MHLVLWTPWVWCNKYVEKKSSSWDFCKHIFNEWMGMLQIGDAADAKAQAAEARQEELLTKEFASKTRVEEHRSESHEESKNGEVTKKTAKSSDKKSETHSRAAEGAGVGEHE